MDKSRQPTGVANLHRDVAYRNEDGIPDESSSNPIASNALSPNFDASSVAARPTKWQRTSAGCTLACFSEPSIQTKMGMLSRLFLCPQPTCREIRSGT